MSSNALSTIVESKGGELLPKNKTHDLRVEIPATDGGKAYVVARRSTEGAHKGRWECSCLGWVMQKGSVKRDCKHLAAMGVVIGQIEDASKAGF